MSTENVKLTESVHKDCIYYKHSSYLKRYCCGGSKLIEIVEMIFCNGNNQSSKQCQNCEKYRRIK